VTGPVPSVPSVPSVLEAVGLVKVYPPAGYGGRSKTALAGVSLSLAEGSCLGVVGESGCGKSTLARLLVGLEQPTAGTVTLQGRPLASYPRPELARRLQLVSQDPFSSLNPRLTAGRALTEVLLVHDGHAEVDVAVADGQVIGFVRYGAGQDEAGGYVFGLYVHPVRAGQGVGRALLRHAEKRLREAGSGTVSLTVFEANERARRLYAKAGYAPDGSTRVEPEYEATEIRLVKALS